MIEFRLLLMAGLFEGSWSTSPAHVCDGIEGGQCS
jgi:hypothetical protein